MRPRRIRAISPSGTASPITAPTAPIPGIASSAPATTRKVAAENVGTGQVNIEEVVKGWKESPGHNQNLLLTDAEHMGIALVQDPKTEFKTFWTLVVGSPL